MCNVQRSFAGHPFLPKLYFVFWLYHSPAVLEVYVQFWGLTGLNAHLWMVVWPNFSLAVRVTASSSVDVLYLWGILPTCSFPSHMKCVFCSQLYIMTGVWVLDENRKYCDHIHGIFIESLMKESGERIIYVCDACFPCS